MHAHACMHTSTSTQVAKIQHFQVSPPGIVPYFSLWLRRDTMIYMRSCKYVVFAVVKMQKNAHTLI